MPDFGPFGDPEEVRRLLRTAGAERESMIRDLFGHLAADPDRAPRMTQTRSGLFVPPAAASPPDPFDRIGVYLTSEDIFGPGHVLSAAAVIDYIKQVSLETVVAWCATWVAKLHHPGSTHEQVDAEFIAAYLDGSHRTRIENLLRDPQSVLLATQTFIVMVKIGLEHCDRRGEPPGEEDVRPLVAAALTLPSHLSRSVDEVIEDVTVGTDAGPLGPYVVANQLFNSAPNWQTAWAVHQRCLRELPRELESHPRVINFEAAFMDATGVALDDLVTVCAMIWAQAVGSGPTFPLTALDALKWETTRLDGVLALVAARPEHLREMLREDASTLGVLWSTKTFDRFPVIRWHHHLTVLHPTWVVNRSTGLWPLLDVRRELERRGERAAGSKVATSVEHTLEHFALEVIEQIVGASRMYRDDALRRAFGRRARVADAAVDYGETWVVVEVTTAGFQLKTSAGVSQETLAQDVDDIIRKARQVEATIDNIRRDETALTQRPTPPGPLKFYPLVVVASRFPGNPVTFTMLRERLERAGVLQAEDCAPLEVMTLDDLLGVEGASEAYGYGLLDLLADKLGGEGPIVPMLEFLAHKLGRNAPLPERVKRSWRAWFDPAIIMLRQAQVTAGGHVPHPPATE